MPTIRYSNTGTFTNPITFSGPVRFMTHVATGDETLSFDLTGAEIGDQVHIAITGTGTILVDAVPLNEKTIDLTEGKNIVIAYFDGTDVNYVITRSTATPIPQLATPANNGVIVASSTQLNVNCDDVVNATTYVLERSANGTSGWAQIYSGATSGFSDTGRTPATQYYYRWKAQGVGYTDSAYSSVANGTTSASDVTAPTVTSANTTDATHIALVFSEVVTTTGVTGFSFRKGGANLAASAVSGAGTNTLTFTVATMANGDVLDYSYNQGTGDCQDAAGNELAALTNVTVTNNIAPSDVIAPTVVSATATSATNIRVVMSEAIVSPTVAGWTFNNGGSITPSAVVLFSGFTYDFTVAGLAPGQTITRAYNSATGAWLDAFNNELATFTGQPVANDVPVYQHASYAQYLTDMIDRTSEVGVSIATVLPSAFTFNRIRILASGGANSVISVRAYITDTGYPTGLNPNTMTLLKEWLFTTPGSFNQVIANPVDLVLDSNYTNVSGKLLTVFIHASAGTAPTIKITPSTSSLHASSLQWLLYTPTAAPYTNNWTLSNGSASRSIPVRLYLNP